MKNLDNEKRKQDELKTKVSAALSSGDNDAVTTALCEMAENIQNNILNEARQAANEDFNDIRVMAKRGLNPLTAEEKAYYNEVIGAGGFAGVEKLVPATVIDRVFEDLEANHPLLNAIDFVNTTGVTEWIIRKDDVAAAWWGELCEEIKKELSNSFEKIQTGLYKLSAYMPVCKAMLDLGPSWLDKFVRITMSESILLGIETALVSGDGKGKPIGMIKDLDGAVVGGVYPDKTAVVLSDLTPKTLGSKVMAPLTKDGKRTVANVLMIVNPLDYWEKIFPETTILTANGAYVYGVLPIPATVVQSVAVPSGTMIAGIGKDYFMGIGSTQKIEYSDEYKFLHDERIYIAKQYANGRPKDNSSFIVFDISTMQESDE